MKEGICFVVGAGECSGPGFRPKKEDFVIAADAGLQYLNRWGISADLIIGDFDTLKDVPDGDNVIRLNCEKDDTDMLAAVREGIKAGYVRFHIYGGTGGRIDHTLANLQVLSYLAENGMQGFLFGEHSIITAIADGELAFEPVSAGWLSVFSCSDRAEGVFLQGLKYPLKDAVLTNTFPVGTSNEFVGEKSRIQVKKGILAVVFPREAKEKIIEPVPHRKHRPEHSAGDGKGRI